MFDATRLLQTLTDALSLGSLHLIAEAFLLGHSHYQVKQEVIHLISL